MRKAHLIIIVSILCTFQLLAQKKSNFEGIIKYSVTFDDSKLPPEAAAMFKNAEVVVYITPEKQRSDINMVVQSTVSIVDMKKKTMFTIMEMGGKKYLIEMNDTEIKKEQKESPELNIKYLEETKEIAGYKCKKAEVAIADASEMVMSVYYTEEIPLNDISPVYKGLKGFPLEYSLSMGGIQMKFSAKTISREDVPESIFEAPSDCIKTTLEDLQTELLKQMGGQ